jgi:hypothetical protein
LKKKFEKKAKKVLQIKKGFLPLQSQTGTKFFKKIKNEVTRRFSSVGRAADL